MARNMQESKTPAVKEPGLQVYPNPVSGGSSTIKYTLPEAAAVRLSVVNMNGQTQTLLNARQAAREHTLRWPSTPQPSGVYILRMQAGRVEKQVRLVVAN